MGLEGLLHDALRILHPEQPIARLLDYQAGRLNFTSPLAGETSGLSGWLVKFHLAARRGGRRRSRRVGACGRLIHGVYDFAVSGCERIEVADSALTVTRVV